MEEVIFERIIFDSKGKCLEQARRASQYRCQLLRCSSSEEVITTRVMETIIEFLQQWIPSDQHNLAGNCSQGHLRLVSLV